jgi:hypothetical protein
VLHGGIGLAGAAVVSTVGGTALVSGAPARVEDHGHGGHPADGPNGEFAIAGRARSVDPAASGFDPSEVLTDFGGGSVSTLPGGRTLHEYAVVARSSSWAEGSPGLWYRWRS